MSAADLDPSNKQSWDGGYRYLFLGLELYKRWKFAVQKPFIHAGTLKIFDITFVTKANGVSVAKPVESGVRSKVKALGQYHMKIILI